MATMRVAPCVKVGRGEREQLLCHAVEWSHSGLARTLTIGRKGNLSHANFMTLLPPLLLFERNTEHGGNRRKAMTPGSLHLVAMARAGPGWASPCVGRRERRAKQARPRVGPAR
jgi:hypothetical protein